ncbi:MAG TPA: hypothetical protein PLB00_09855 [Pseudomonadota bacterium]|nr:hypothetical protein [Pseudomonadota bacterium]
MNPATPGKKCRIRVGAIVLISLATLSTMTPAFAYKIGSPSHTQATKEEVKRRFGSSSLVDTLFDRFGHPVHESILARSYGCVDSYCEEVPVGVLRGLLWADMPSGFPVRGRAGHLCKRINVGLQANGELPEPACTIGYIVDGGKVSQRMRHRGKRGEFHTDAYLTLYRTHYGDMQWMHAMAESLDEPAQITQSSMLAWSEYLYRLSTKDKEEQIALSQPLSGIPYIAKWFSDNKSEWNSRDLFATGQFGVDEETIRDMAFGALLHMLQDSYSGSHARRDFGDLMSSTPGLIIGFLTYPAQEAKCHSPADAEPLSRGNEWWNSSTGKAVVGHGERLIALRDRSAKTAEVVEWLKESAFPISKDARPAAGGFGRECRQTGRT